MPWRKWVILFLVIFSSGWMLFDGLRALLVGDFVTPQSGDYAGQLGPWTMVARAAGLEPRSTLMKAIFVVQGAATLALAICHSLNIRWARTGLLVAAIVGLWFLPFGTLSNLLVILLLSRPAK